MFWNILITISISKYHTWCSYGIQFICRNYNESREIGFTFLSTVIYRVHFFWWNPQFLTPEILPRILTWIQFHLRMKVERFCLTNVSYPEPYINFTYSPLLFPEYIMKVERIFDNIICYSFLADVSCYSNGFHFIFEWK